MMTHPYLTGFTVKQHSDYLMAEAEHHRLVTTALRRRREERKAARAARHHVDNPITVTQPATASVKADVAPSGNNAEVTAAVPADTSVPTADVWPTVSADVRPEIKTDVTAAVKAGNMRNSAAGVPRERFAGNAGPSERAASDSRGVSDADDNLSACEPPAAA